jgi:hypothetical protein
MSLSYRIPGSCMGSEYVVRTLRTVVYELVPATVVWIPLAYSIWLVYLLAFYLETKLIQQMRTMMC